MAGSKDDPFDRGRSRREEIAYAELIAELGQLRHWWEEARLRPGVLPPPGAPAAPRRPDPVRRTKLTLQLDADLLRWFRAMGLGYQARMNHALRSWMRAVTERERPAGSDG